MSDQILTIDSILLKEIFFELIIPLIIFSITTYIAVSTRQKSIETEKNQYLNPLKQNEYILKTFKKIGDLNYHKNQSFTVFFIGIIFGFVYFIVILFILLILFPFIVIILNNSSHFLLHVEPINEENLYLIFCTYLHFSFIPLFLFTIILFYLIECENKMNVIKPILIKQKWLGKKIQVLKCKFWSSIKISKPSFTNEMTLTQKSISFLNLFPILMAISLTTNFFIYYFSFSLLIQLTKDSFTLSIGYLQNTYLSVASVLGDWLFFILSIYVVSLTFLTLFCLWLYQRASRFLEESKNEIIKVYSEGYPFIHIKTPSGILEGKVEDIFNKHFILLNDNGTQKITLWNKVGIIEIKKNDK